MSKRVALVADVEGWAWWRRGCGIRRYAPSGYQAEVYTHKTFGERHGKFDAVLHMSWTEGDVRYRGRPTWALVANSGLMHPHDPSSQDFGPRSASRLKNVNTARQRLPLFGGIISINHRATAFCRKYNANTVQLRTGVDHQVFLPDASRKPTSGQLRIGWCGKPSTGEKWSPKGYHEVLLPLLRRYSSQITFELNTRDYTNRLETDDMVDWYRSIDALLITSSAEGTPSTALECMACGTPVISTRVGVVPELVEHGVNGYLVDAYDNYPESQETLRQFCELFDLPPSRAALGAMGEEARRTILDEGWTWQDLSREWLETVVAEKKSEVRSQKTEVEKHK